MSISPAIPADPVQSPAQSQGPLRVYVAGASREPGRVRTVMRALKAEPNVEVTHDWLAEMERRPEDTMLSHELVSAARDDISGLVRATVLLFLLPHEPSPGAWFELGFFARSWLTSDAGELIISGDAHGTLFTAWLRDAGADRAPTDADAVARIARMALRLGGGVQ